MKHIPVIRITAVKDKTFKYETKVVDSSTRAAEMMKTFLDEHCCTDRENFIVMALDTRSKIVGLTINSTGCINEVPVLAKDVFKIAILNNSSRIIVAHNHPSGEVTPSEADIKITKRLKDAGDILGIDVLDHIIVGDSTYSFAEHGLI